MLLSGLLPNEEVIEQVPASHKQMEGILLLTNCRLLWKRVGDIFFSVNENRLNIGEVQKSYEVEKNRYLIKVGGGSSKGKGFIFSFPGSEGKEIHENVAKILQKKPNQNDIAFQSMPEDSIVKIYQLQQNPQLNELFDDLVLTQKKLTEKEFWDHHLKLSEGTGLGSSVANLVDQKSQASAISNRPFLLIPRQNVQTQKSEFSLEQGDCKRLLIEFPALREAYESRVPLKTKETEFWQKFLEKNFQYKSEIFGGNNPIFIPFKTNEKDYEDAYIHISTDAALKKAQEQKKEAAHHKDKQKVLLDVDFIKNSEANDLPQGYGSYQKECEIDSMSILLESCQFDQELKRQFQKDAENQVEAMKVINKYNSNSKRIIESNKIQRHLDKNEEQKEKLEEEEKVLEHREEVKMEIDSSHQIERGLQTKMAQNVPQFQENRVNRKSREFIQQQYKQLGAILRQQIDNKEHMKFVETKPSEMKDFNKKLLAEINENLKFLEFQNNIEVIKKKIPPQVFEKYLQIFKKFKMLLRHTYAQLEQCSSYSDLEKMRELIAYLESEAVKMNTYIKSEDIKKYEGIFKQQVNLSLDNLVQINIYNQAKRNIQKVNSLMNSQRIQ